MRAGPVGDECCHNARLIGPLAPGQTVPIPYDFDFSGLVSAPYAGPPPELDIADIRQRLYRGYCIHNADALAAARQFSRTSRRSSAYSVRSPAWSRNAAEGVLLPRRVLREHRHRREHRLEGTENLRELMN